MYEKYTWQHFYCINMLLFELKVLVYDTCFIMQTGSDFNMLKNYWNAVEIVLDRKISMCSSSGLIRNFPFVSKMHFLWNVKALLRSTMEMMYKFHNFKTFLFEEVSSLRAGEMAQQTKRSPVSFEDQSSDAQKPCKCL